MKLEALPLWMAQRSREWRNEIRETLRTPFFLTEKMQEDFYYSLTRNSNNRYWMLSEYGVGVGMGGLVGIEWENSLAEISLILDPEHRRKGLGGKAVAVILYEGFNNMNLSNIYGECYLSNPNIEFWRAMIEKRGAREAILPNRKYWNGRYWDSLYFNFSSNQRGCSD